MTRSELARQLRRDHPELTLAQIKDRTGLADSSLWSALKRCNPATKMSASIATARRLRTMHPGMSVVEVARRSKLTVSQTVEALDNYAPKRPKARRKGTGYKAAKCLDCRNPASRDGRCFMCAPAHERRQRALQLARRTA
jgi:hypothetical protein